MLGARRPARPAWAFVSACGAAGRSPAPPTSTWRWPPNPGGRLPYVVGTLWSVVDDVAIRNRPGRSTAKSIHPAGWTCRGQPRGDEPVSLDLRRRLPRVPVPLGRPRPLRPRRYPLAAVAALGGRQSGHPHDADTRSYTAPRSASDDGT